MLKINQLHFQYPTETTTVLNIPNLHIPKASFSLVIGPSGGGKSTLLRLTNGLVPHFTGGSLTGKILVNGLDPIHSGPHVMSRHVGFVFQEPENQFVVDVVEDEIAFSLENSGIPRPQMKERINTVLSQLNINHLRNRKLSSLSGGEAQRVAIAAVLVLKPALLVLDEPTSQLDPLSANQVLNLLEQLRTAYQLTILIAEHRIERVLPFCDRLIIVPGGDLPTTSGERQSMLPEAPYLPPVTELFRQKNKFPLPVSVKEAAVRREELNLALTTSTSTRQTTIPAKPILSIQNLSVELTKVPILQNIHFDLAPGERLVIMGPNGAGKSTLLRSLVGLVKPSKGKIQFRGKDITNTNTASLSQHIGLLPQDPNALLFSETVFQELEHTLKNHKQPVNPKVIMDLLRQLSLHQESERYPRDLSSGERQRVALGAVCITKPSLLLLDEPTHGLDPDAKNNLISLLKTWNQAGMSFILVTHDVEFAAAFAQRVIILEEGKITAQGQPQTILKQNPIFTPQIMQLFPETGWMTLNDLPS
jgi:energy-coupling factor transport system ATP-binding protein